METLKLHYSNRNLYCRFNSATTFQPWKLATYTVELSPALVLQFGHDLSAVETSLRITLQSSKITMLQFGHDLSAVETWRWTWPSRSEVRPLQFGHDLSAVETEITILLCRLQPSCFNSATTFQPWRHEYSLSGVCPRAASIRPRPFSRGNCLIIGIFSSSG